MSVQSDELTPSEGAITTAPAAKRIQTGVVRVNLIPAELAEARQLRATIVAAAGVAAIAVVAVGLLYHGQASKVSDAKAQLAAAQAENQKLVLEQSRLGNVDDLYAKVDAAEAMLTTAEAPQILWSRYLEDVRLQLPQHVWLTNLTATESTSGTGGATVTTGTPTVAGTTGATTSATPATIGSLSFSGSAYTHNDVANLLDRLASLHGVASPYLSSSTQVLVGTGGNAISTINWAATATLNSDALKSSYEDGTGTP